MKSKQLLIIFACLFTINIFSMGGGAEKTGRSHEPRFTELRRGEANFAGQVIDGAKTVDIKEISFSGTTKLGGIRSEKDDSRTELDLAQLKEIEVLNSNYKSDKFDGEFALVKAESKKGGSAELLIPRDVHFSAINSTTGFGVAWFLRDIQKLVISPIPLVEKPKEK